MADWPRGVRKTQVDEWARSLALDKAKLRASLDGKMSWSDDSADDTKRVEKDGQDALAALRSRSKKGETLTLLCWCHDETRCHRSVLRAILEGQRRPSS